MTSKIEIEPRDFTSQPQLRLDNFYIYQSSNI